MSRPFALLTGGCLALASCGGGGGSPPPPPPPPATTLAVTLSRTSQSVTAIEDASQSTLSFTATQVGTSADPVFADVQYDKDLLTLQGSLTPTTPGTYDVSFKTRNDAGGGLYNGTVTFRLCRDSACASVYAGSTQTFSYVFDVQLKDWTAFQRNPAHNGYVHASIQPASIKKAWEWMPANVQEFSSVATKGGTAFVTRRNADGTSSVHALATATGSEQWSYGLAKIHSFSGPSVSGDRLFVTTMVTSSSDNRIVTLNPGTGQFIRNLTFASQWSVFAPPTPYGDELYHASGYYGNVLYSFDTAAGTTRWTANGAGGDIWDGQTPAVDEKNAYYYSGRFMDVFDRATGKRVTSMQDPFFTWGGYSFNGGPMLGGKANVLAFSGTDNSRWISPKPLVNYSLASGSYTWRSADVYVTTPAVAKGVVYLARNMPARLDALDEETGKILWSWAPPAGESFLGNSVVTDNLLFVSTDAQVYAISLTDPAHPMVWSAPTPGLLAVSGDSRLIVSAPLEDKFAKRLTAYALR